MTSKSEVRHLKDWIEGFMKRSEEDEYTDACEANEILETAFEILKRLIAADFDIPERTQIEGE